VAVNASVAEAASVNLPRPATRIRPRNRQHRCFELAARMQCDDPTWSLVHGYIDGWIEHAWLRREGVVYDAVQDKSYTVEQYTTEFAAKEVASYDLKTACRLIAYSGLYRFLPAADELARRRP
jgi:hypothetical protein